MAFLISVPTWSQACAAHDSYELQNGVIEHPENAALPGASPGGAWGGLDSVLSVGSGWTSEYNPWMDAPLHLMQLFTPAIQYVGLDDTQSYACATTWPGMVRSAPPVGTVTTFPGDGTTGLPPEEFASESPTVPGSEVGIEGLAGRELFIWEQGAPEHGGLKIQSASLTSAAGPVEVRWVDQTGNLGGYMTGGIVIPVHPLQPMTTYTATVTLADLSTSYAGVLPQATHTWTFTTGADNPGGTSLSHGTSGTTVGGGGSPSHQGYEAGSSSWVEEGTSAPAGPSRQTGPELGARSVLTSYVHGKVVVRGVGFDPGKVAVRRREGGRNGKVLARATVRADGSFRTAFGWPRKSVSFRVVDGREAVAAAFTPGRSR
jgi:hypothetical protein